MRIRKYDNGGSTPSGETKAEKTARIHAERAANIEAIRRRKKENYNSHNALFERPYDHPYQAVGALGLAPILGAGSAATVLPVELAALLTAITGAGVAGAVEGKTNPREAEEMRVEDKPDPNIIKQLIREYLL